MIEINGKQIYGTNEQEEIELKRKEMRKELNLILGQLFALRLENNMCKLYIEDDGTLFEKSSFHITWIDDLENVLHEFKKLAKENGIATVSEHTKHLEW
jgi:ubiquinone/menaquinone biosynthesis C-methylase UbiE